MMLLDPTIKYRYIKETDLKENINSLFRDQKIIIRLIQRLNAALRYSALFFNIENVDFSDVDDKVNDFFGSIENSGQYDYADNPDIVLKYEDVQGNVLDDFLEFTFDEYISFISKTYNGFIKENIAPYPADHIGVYLGNEKIDVLPLKDLASSDKEVKYSVGLLSDVHYNDYDKGNDDPDTFDDDGSEFYKDVRNFFKVFNDTNKIDFVSIAGDVSTDLYEHFVNFWLLVDKYGNRKPCFSCYGNHDFAATHSSSTAVGHDGFGFVDDRYISRVEYWNMLMFEKFNSQLDGKIVNIRHYDEDMRSTGYATFSFEVPLPGTSKSDVYIYLSVDYDNNTNMPNIRLSYDAQDTDKHQTDINKMFEYVYKNTYGGKDPAKRTYNEAYYDLQLYDSGTLLWFADTLERYKDKRVFVFTHQFFPHKAGNNNGGTYYSYAYDDYRISHNSAYCLCGIQFEFLNYLNNKYSNSIWITGHSHYKWEWQKYDSAINLTNVEYEYVEPGSERWLKDMRSRYTVVNFNKTWYEMYDDERLFDSGMALVAKVNDLKTGTKFNIAANAYACYAKNNSSLEDTDYAPGDIIARLQVYDPQNKRVLASTDISLVYPADIKEAVDISLQFTSSVSGVEVRLILDTRSVNWLALRVNCVTDSDSNDIIDSISVKYIAYDYTNDVKSDYYTPNVQNGSQLPQRKKRKVKRTGTAYNLHLPSTSRPIPIKTDYYRVTGQDSQAAIMNVYEDYVEVRGIVLKDGYGDQYINKHIPLAQYRIPIKAK